MTTLALGKKALSNLMESESSPSGKNEAQTRFKIIDKVLFECLGWTTDEVEVEKNEGRKFTDYELGQPRLAILEAKREGQTFEIPAGSSEKLLVDLNSLILIDEKISDVINQAQGYCNQRGVAIAIVSNGHQYIAFLASRQDGVSVLDGKALVFNSLKHLYDNFPQAWQLLSAEGIKERNLIRYLSFNEVVIPNKLSSKLRKYPKIRYPSEIQATLKQLSELLIQDIVDDKQIEKKFFNECYCESGALSKFTMLSKNVLNTRYASLFSDSEPHPTVLPVKQKKKDNFSPDILAEAMARRPIVLIGDVGVGKTSFVKNLIYNSAYEEFKSAVYIYIDLGSNAALSDNLNEFVLNEIERQLIYKYNVNIYESSFITKAYQTEVELFSSGLWGGIKTSNPEQYQLKLIEELASLTKEKDQHIKRSLKYFSKKSSKQIIISIDNADQRDFEIQQSAFIISQELAKEWNATVFLSVRPQTFFKSKRAGALTAYPHKIFTISPPRIDRVIEKRLSFALRMSDGSIPIETLKSVELHAENLSQFLKALISSLNKNSELNEFLSNITAGNIRAAIEFVTNFIGSPNIDAEKIIEIMNHQGTYTIPLHEFTKSALLGEYSHYNPDTSIAMNVLDISSPDSSEHFLIPILLAFLDLDEDHRDNNAFCSTSTLMNELQNNGYTHEQIEKALRRATNKKLLITSQRITFEEDVNNELIGSMPDSFRVSSIGLYHLHRWLGTFSYLDAMSFDTPILDASTRDKIIDQDLDSLSIANRLQRTILFKQYLIECWNRLSPQPRYFNFLELLQDEEKSFDDVIQAVSRTKVT